MENYTALPLHQRINLRGNLKALEFKSGQLYMVAGNFCNRPGRIAAFVQKHCSPVWF